jgi:hypothetical protein
LQPSRAPSRTIPSCPQVRVISWPERRRDTRYSQCFGVSIPWTYRLPGWPHGLDGVSYPDAITATCNTHTLLAADS